jgi:hypothetical protein
MNRISTPAVAALALATSAELAIASSIEIRHEPVPCAVSGRYTRVSATAVPPEQAASAELQFRESATGGWYAVRMSVEGGVWSAVLPRPVRPLQGFEYRVVMVSPKLETTETAATAVRVDEDAAQCGGAHSSLEVAAPIVVRVPAGAPAVPAVPPGFSPAGVVAATEPPPAKSGMAKTAWIVGGGAAVAGVAAAAAGSSATQPLGEPPEFTFFGSTPDPGATVRIGSVLALNVLPSARNGVTLAFMWRADFPSIGPDANCVVSMSGTIVNAIPTVPVRLSGPLVRSNQCRPPVIVAIGFLTITIDGEIVYGEALDLPYTFVE